MDISRAPVVLASGALFAVSVVGLVGRDDGGTAVAAGPQAVSIADFEFGPVALSVGVGDTVTWSNQDEAAHTVTSVGEGPLGSDDLGQDATYELTFSEAGTYAYFCELHPFMKGSVEVAPA